MGLLRSTSALRRSGRSLTMFAEVPRGSKNSGRWHSCSCQPLRRCSRPHAARTRTKGETLYVGGIPDQDTSLLVRRFGSLAEYLSERLGVEVEYVPSVDYAAVVTGFKNGDIHLAWYGGFTGVQARNAVPGARAIAQRPRDERFLSVFIVGSGVDAEGLADLEGADVHVRQRELDVRSPHAAPLPAAGRHRPRRRLSRAAQLLRIARQDVEAGRERRVPGGRAERSRVVPGPSPPAGWTWGRCGCSGRRNPTTTTTGRFGPTWTRPVRYRVHPEAPGRAVDDVG